MTDLELLPPGRAEQLLILLHGVGADPSDLKPLALRLREQFPQSAALLPRGFDPFDMGRPGRQWFSLQGLNEDNRVARVTAMLPRLIAWVHAAQQRLQVGPAATALVGFSQGSIVALEAVSAEDGLAGRVVAFSGRYARLPDRAPTHTTIHLLHGGRDPVMPADHARRALDHLGALHGDATLDIAQEVGHELHPALIDCALQRLTSHIPMRTWMAAMGGLRQSTEPDAAHPPVDSAAGFKGD
jgi:phospholipase/carboxylesterase